MKASLFAFMVAGLASAPGASATIIRNDYHLSGTYNDSGGGYTEVWTTLPNSSHVASVDWEYIPYDETFVVPLTITFPAAPEGSDIFASALFFGGTVTWAEYSVQVEPIVSDCGGTPCPYGQTFAIGHPQQIYVLDPVSGNWSNSAIVHFTPDLAGKTFQLEIELTVPYMETIGGPFNSKTTYTRKGPTYYSLDVSAITEYTHAPEPASVALLGLAAGMIAYRFYSLRRR